MISTNWDRRFYYLGFVFFGHQALYMCIQYSYFVLPLSISFYFSLSLSFYLPLSLSLSLSLSLIISLYLSLSLFCSISCSISLSLPSPFLLSRILFLFMFISYFLFSFPLSHFCHLSHTSSLFLFYHYIEFVHGKVKALLGTNIVVDNEYWARLKQN